jgi:hypothetical protein
MLRVSGSGLFGFAGLLGLFGLIGLLELLGYWVELNKLKKHNKAK